MARLRRRQPNAPHSQSERSPKEEGQRSANSPAGRSVGTAFRRQCQQLKIDDLHFHDLRHEGTSRLFEAGFSIEQVALITGYKDWKVLRRLSGNPHRTDGMESLWL
nr:tyrosine-type recombinase/integrase [Bradyrhizobium sp. SZCCHNR1051]